MTALVRTTTLQALADLICLSVILYLVRGHPTSVITAYYATKILAFTAFGGRR